MRRERGGGGLEGMIGDVNAQQLPLPSELLGAQHGRRLQLERRHRRRNLVAEEIEHRRLAGIAQLLLALGERDEAVEVGEQRAAVAEGRERAGLGQALQRALVHRLEVDAPAEVLDRGERAVAVAFFHDALGGAGADVLDLLQAEADRLLQSLP